LFITVCGQKGGVAKTCTSIHLASVWAFQGKKVFVVDADRNRSAIAYGSRGKLPFQVVPVEAAAKATRLADVVITDGQASTDEDELKHLAIGSDLVLLPTAPQARSVELTVELATLMTKLNVPHAVILVKVDIRQKRYADQARDALMNIGIPVLSEFVPLLSAFDKAENDGVAVLEAVDDRGRSDPRRMTGWSAYCSIAKQIQCQILKHSSNTNNQLEDLRMTA
tara:strand:+ start:103 stop:774 length:672 start_codon:yes stop_codon:yes gene_type:complete